MTRARAAWLAAGIVVISVLAYLVRRRRAAPGPLPVRLSERAPVRVTHPAVEGISENEEAVAENWQRFKEASQVGSDDIKVMEREQPLAAGIRVAIVLLALLAFFAVSLIATK
ncbi:MAG: hypothetical protein QOJ79_846 [Actinomycetota bacterium]|nr:hypothetical protein [Actinomycetota bacterium]